MRGGGTGSSWSTGLEGGLFFFGVTGHLASGAAVALPAWPSGRFLYSTGGSWSSRCEARGAHLPQRSSSDDVGAETSMVSVAFGGGGGGGSVGGLTTGTPLNCVQATLPLGTLSGGYLGSALPVP